MNSKTFFISTTVWVATLASAFWLGNIQGRNSASNVNVSGPLQVSSGDRSSLGETTVVRDRTQRLIRERADEASGGASGTANLSTDAVRANFEAAFAESDRLLRMEKFLDALKGLNSENAPEMYAMVMSNSSGYERWQQMQAFSYAWGRLDGPGAIDFIAQNSRGREANFISAVAMTGWASSDPATAQQWYLDNAANLENANSIAMGLVQGMVDSDISAASDFIANIPTGGARNRMIGMISEGMVQGDPSTATRWASSFSDPDMRNTAMEQVARDWARTDPQAAGEWARQNINDAAGTQLVSRVAGEMASQDPQSAMAYLATLPATSEARSAGLSSAINQWVRDDPAGAGEWLNNQPAGAATDQAVATYAQRVSRDDPEAALTWAESITDPALREQSIISVGQDYYRQNSEAATQWLESQNLSDEAKQQIQNPPQQRRGGGWRR